MLSSRQLLRIGAETGALGKRGRLRKGYRLPGRKGTNLTGIQTPGTVSNPGSILGEKEKDKDFGTSKGRQARRIPSLGTIRQVAFPGEPTQDFE
jgi:hypothetical protein